MASYQAVALIVDDEPDIRELISMTLEKMNVRCQEAASVAEAKQKLKQAKYSLCITDMRLPDGNGIDLVKYMQHNFANLPVAVITAYGNMELAVKALKAGAFDFVSKPVKLTVLRDLVETALKLASTSSKSTQESAHKLLGDSNKMVELRKMIYKLSRSQAPVLIMGESGTGKELVARLIHESGPRAEHAFVAVNCGAIPHELMESELFGHKKGSFTGAVADKDGLFQAANHGTLFLDEVAELPINLQVKLLRAIQEKSVRPIGAQAEVSVDVRILSATHKDLAEAVSQGLFRQDLYYRINVIDLIVPSLKERREDIPLHTEDILQKIAENYGEQKSVLSKSALEALMNYDFPGNIRELENILEKAATLCENSEITDKDLQLQSNGMPHQLQGEMDLATYMDSIEKDVIIKALENNQGDKHATAKQLGISLRALRYRLKKLDLDL